MAEAHCRQAWNHTSALLALIYNIHRDPKRSSAKKPEDLNPHQERKKTPHEELPQVPITVLKEIFVDRRPGECGSSE